MVINKWISSIILLYINWGTCLSCCETELYSMYTIMCTRSKDLFMQQLILPVLSWPFKPLKRESSSGCSQLLSLQFLLRPNFNVPCDATVHGQEMLQQLHLLTSKLLRRQEAE